METEVIMPSLRVNFNFYNGCAAPYMSALSSPSHDATLFYSALASPTRGLLLNKVLHDVSRPHSFPEISQGLDSLLDVSKKPPGSSSSLSKRNASLKKLKTWMKRLIGLNKKDQGRSSIKSSCLGFRRCDLVLWMRMMSPLLRLVTVRKK
ncbi:hypothetical protein HAX54_025814 [Datura stramonium]|uniref:Uncharacterized protein n=1 Tax=Datura stramonium TaxID=4076 RepID=A0ABS8V273_DATST|nr:hypothetical protein [Datura stramonium]